ncbi:hypothetical protein AHAS_Ahas13G0227200 [Arachis hypogaea]
MQHDYDCFGDVLAFDSTYRKNLYNRPPMIFSGVLDVMRQKEPMVVVTDGNESMKEAIWSEFPNATHQLCSWNLAWNTVSNIKDANFLVHSRLRSENCLLELVEDLDCVVKDYQNNEFMFDFKSLYSEPMMITGLESIEKAVSKVYTWEIFFEVNKQIWAVTALIVLHNESYGNIEKFMLRKF